MLLVCTSSHVLAALIPLVISLPVWLSSLILPALSISLFYQFCKIQLRLPNSIIALELNGEECRPLFRKSDLNPQLTSEAWCSPLIQILYFSVDVRSLAMPQKNQKFSVLRAFIHRISDWHIALIICADSCTAEEQRQLRKFLRWRVLC